MDGKDLLKTFSLPYARPTADPMLGPLKGVNVFRNGTCLVVSNGKQPIGGVSMNSSRCVSTSTPTTYITSSNYRLGSGQSISTNVGNPVSLPAAAFAGVQRQHEPEQGQGGPVPMHMGIATGYRKSQSVPGSAWFSHRVLAGADSVTPQSIENDPWTQKPRHCPPLLYFNFSRPTPTYLGKEAIW